MKTANSFGEVLWKWLRRVLLISVYLTLTGMLCPRNLIDSKGYGYPHIWMLQSGRKDARVSMNFYIPQSILANWLCSVRFSAVTLVVWEH